MSSEKKKSGEIELKGAVIKGVDSWTEKLGEKLNNLGIGYSTTTNPKIMQATLLPAMITESSGIVFNTQMIGARDKSGQIRIPKEFQLPMMIPESNQRPQPMLKESPRIVEIDESNEPLQNENLARVNELQKDVEFTAEMINPNLSQNATQNQNSNSQPQDINYESREASPERSQRSSPPMENQNQNNLLNRQTRSNPQNPQPTSTTFGAKYIPGSPADNYYNLNQPSAYSAMDYSKFRRYNNVVSRHKPYRSRFRRNHIIAPGLYTFLFADTIHAYKYNSEDNSNYRYILVVVDALSRQSFVRPLYTTRADECARQFLDICLYLDLPGSPFLVSDQGSEFSTEFDKAVKEWGFQRFKLAGRHKAAIAERFM